MAAGTTQLVEATIVVTVAAPKVMVPLPAAAMQVAVTITE